MEKTKERPLRDRVDTEERLIEAAADLLGELGPRAVSVRVIAERAGVNHGLVHHYFGGKAGLLRSAMTKLVKDHESYAVGQSKDKRYPAPLALTGDQRYLRAVLRCVLDGEMELAEMELTTDSSVPRAALTAEMKRRNVSRADAQLKAAFGLFMATEMGWAALEPFIFSVTQTANDKEKQEVRDAARTQLRQMEIEKFR